MSRGFETMVASPSIPGRAMWRTGFAFASRRATDDQHDRRTQKSCPVVSVSRAVLRGNGKAIDICSSADSDRSRREHVLCASVPQRAFLVHVRIRTIVTGVQERSTRTATRWTALFV
jgi:hypothetical protein